MSICGIIAFTKFLEQISGKEFKLGVMKLKLNRAVLLVVIFMALILNVIVPSQAAAVEPDLAHKLPKYPADGQTNSLII